MGEKLHTHMNEYLAQKAKDTESAALQSLIPGFIVQPRYRSGINFGLPLEVRVVTLFGKARVGVWWWGRRGSGKDNSHRDVWIVRRPVAKTSLGDDDEWDIVHEHVG